MMIVIFVVNQLWSNFVGGPLEYQDRLQNRLLDQIQSTKNKINRDKRAQRRLGTWRDRSLPADVQAARTLYQGWLHELTERVGLEKRFVDSGTPISGKGYQILPFTVRGIGSMDQFTHLLFDFYQAPHLHRIRTMAIVPIAGGSRLDLSLAIDALVVNGCRQRDQLPTGRADVLAANDLLAYRVISDRNLFGQNPQAEIAQHTILTAVVVVDRETEAWFTNQIEGKNLKLRVGDSLQAGWFEGTVVRIDEYDVILESAGQRWLLTKGDCLTDAVALPPEY
ncbi:MAG: hypothetical protein JW829_20755 [Pirellulales bacterium]|nr:hypothetical protein [Pirellulales bacterium]